MCIRDRSHEIRTPLNAIMGMTDLVIETNLNAEQKDYLSTVKESSNHLLDVINDILDHSKIVAGKIEFKNTNFSLKKTMDSIIKLLKVQAEKKKLLLKLEIEYNIPDRLKGDSARLRQILVNIIGNAIKFTQRGEITLSIKHHPPGKKYTDKDISLVFSIEDTGIGNPESKINSIFDSFNQADASYTRRFGGTGLGLTITRQLIELLGGAIHVESRYGVGSNFLFNLYFDRASDRTLEAKNPDNVIPKYRHNRCNTNRQLKILVVEDNPVNTKVANITIKKIGHSVINAVNGIEAIEKLSNDSFDIVFMDIEMPEMDGLEATKRIRRGESGRKIISIPIIAMTAHVLPEVREQCKISGMDYFIAKPFKIAEVKTVIQKFSNYSSSSSK